MMYKLGIGDIFHLLTSTSPRFIFKTTCLSQIQNHGRAIHTIHIQFFLFMMNCATKLINPKKDWKKEKYTVV